MKIRTLIVLILLTLLLGTRTAHAEIIISEFNGTGFQFEAGTFAGSTSIGPSFITIDRFATERGIGGFVFDSNFTGLGIALTAQLGAGNQASELWVRLVDGADNSAVFVFPASRFTTTGFTTVFVPTPTFLLGNVNLASIHQVWIMGDFSSDDFMRVSIDHLVATDHLCGNTVLEQSEQCDDGNTNNGDGCSSTCQNENRPPVARCKDVPLDATATSCSFPADINNGSSDPDTGDSITLSQSPAGPYGLGSRAVTLTVTDSHEAQSTCTGTVTVRDSIPPPLTCPGSVTAECTGASTVVTFATPQPGADNCGLSQSTGCNPAPGSGFAVGSTAVSCGATDTRNTASCSFNVNIVDTIAPSITCPGTQTVEATSAAGASVSFTNPTASDACTTPSVSCNAPSGSTFPLGGSTVNCSASDGSNSNSCSFNVTVRDTTPPTITCPANVIVTSGQPINLGTPTVNDLVDPNPTVSNNAPAMYPLGATTVTWEARDAAGNGATCTQTVTIQKAPPAFIAMTNISAKVEVERGPLAVDDELELQMAFTLGANSNGINPRTEPVVVQVGPVSITIPAGSFRVDNKGVLKFAGTLNGVRVEAKLIPLGGARYALKVEAKPLELTTFPNPAAVTVTIGDDQGTATVSVSFE